MKTHTFSIISHAIWLFAIFMLVPQSVSAAEPSVFYVRTTTNKVAWLDQPTQRVYTDLQEAIEAASLHQPAEVWVAAGSYQPSSAPNFSMAEGTKDLHFSLRNGVRVIGGFEGIEQTNTPKYKASDALVNNMENQTILAGKDETLHMFYHPDVAALDEQAVLENVVITGGNGGVTGGGAMYNYECSPTLNNCLFLTNTAETGGALYNHFSNPSVNDCIFVGNYAAADGGAVYNRNASPILRKCQFIENTATQNGGAIANNESSPQIFDSTFSENKTTAGDGGAMYCEANSAPKLTDVKFMENTAAHYGGAAAGTNSAMTFSNAALIKNKALYGGGVYQNNAKLCMTNSNLNANMANDGGGIYGENAARIVLANCDLTRNAATANGGGISIYGSDLDIDNTWFKENMAVYGGGISNEGGNCSVLGAAFISNYATENGGGIMSRSSSHSDSTLNVVNSTFTGNMTDFLNRGAALYCDDYASHISNSIMSGNTSSHEPSEWVTENGSTPPVFLNNIIGDSFYSAYDQKQAVGFDPATHLTANFELNYGKNPAVNKGDNQLFTDAFTDFTVAFSDKRFDAYDLYGGRRNAWEFTTENAVDLGAVEFNAPREMFRPPVPVVSATSDGRPYISGSKTNDDVDIIAQLAWEDMLNFPLIAKNGYIEPVLYYDDGTGSKPYQETITSTDSQTFSFWTSVDDSNVSEKVPFTTNVEQAQPVIERVLFDTAEGMANVSVQAQTLTLQFDRPIRATADISILLTQDILAAVDLMPVTTVVGDHIAIDMSAAKLQPGMTYQLEIQGFKDDYDNVMMPYTVYFTTAVSDEIITPIVSGVLASPATLPALGGSVVFTITGAKLQFTDSLHLTDGSTTLSATATIDGTTARTDTFTLPPNTTEAAQKYAFTVFMNGLDTGKKVEVIVAKPSARRTTTVQEIEESMPRSQPTEKIPPFGIIINGMPYTTNEMDMASTSERIQLSSVEGVASAIVPNYMLMVLKDANPNYILRFDSPWASYDLPVALTDQLPAFDALLQENGLKPEDISFKITMRDNARNDQILSQVHADMPSATFVVTPVECSLEAINKEGKIISGLQELSSYTTIRLPVSGALTDNVGAYWISDTQPQFIPYQPVTKDGKKYATIETYHNGNFFLAENTNAFSDMEGHWAKRHVNQAAALGLVHGTDATHFEPQENVTKAEFAYMLATTLNLPPAEDVVPYTDVEAEAWYYDELMRAKSAGLLNGLTTVTLRPNEPVSREEMACMLASALIYEGVAPSYELPPIENIFKDYEDINISYWADVQQVLDEKIMSGVMDEQFAPRKNATRAEAAVVQMKLLKTLSNPDSDQ